MSNEAKSIETKITVADPTALGVFGLAMVTLVASSQKLGWTTGVSGIFPWAIFLGALAQFIAGMYDFKKNNYFGAIVLTSYGLFWFGVATSWAITLGWMGPEFKASFSGVQLGWAFLGYGIFSFFIMIASFETNKVFAAILVLINLLLASLALTAFQVVDLHLVAGWSEFAISMLGFYGCGAIFLNTFFGRTVLPLGAPLGLIRKGPSITEANRQKTRQAS
ncbi:gpr1/fun34/yaah family protein, putative [Heliomicrobium modesticaldum Ice1]|uniref:Gpr1/fun34/yaah family protein, putative n=1 Tax=Heliobacterium modesticaldum (strain ATCC 51547 / Ice1) TaxID=498761 RepID=B0TBH5_HELMI|nr:GPR1/FUN34/YaaH family transporter [Heliomicrobium modesticaldum]ABZ85188.1 gpr1/fun34/yaah family protein, putative [Heliomicrobium modesticaldum Ice1]